MRLLGTNEVIGPDGRWECAYTGTSDPHGRNDGLVSAMCRSTEGYAGLTYMWQLALSFDGTGDFGGETNMHGLIYEGPPPPWGPIGSVE